MHNMLHLPMTNPSCETYFLFDFYTNLRQSFGAQNASDVAQAKHQTTNIKLDNLLFFLTLLLKDISFFVLNPMFIYTIVEYIIISWMVLYILIDR